MLSKVFADKAATKIQIDTHKHEQPFCQSVQDLNARDPVFACQVDANGVMTRIWPRLSAVAERLWSDPDTGWKEAEDRLAQHR